jgi:hypothetical protein
MLYAIIAAAIIVVALCLHYSTQSYGTERSTKMRDDMWDEMGLTKTIGDVPISGDLPGDPWGTIYHDD